MFEHVIVPLDGSSRALRALAPAAVLARQQGAELVLVCVTDLEDILDRERRLKELAAGLAVRVAVRVFWTESPERRLAQLQAQYRSPLVVMATHGRRPFGAAVFGTVAGELLRLGCGPVALIGPRYRHRDEPVTDVVVPMDGSALAASIVPFACTLSQSLEARLHLVEVIAPEAVERVRAQFAGSDVSEGALLARMAEELAREGHCADWDVLHGVAPADAIVEYVDRIGRHPVVAMSTHGRTGLALATAGSVTTRVLHRVSVAVFVVRPTLGATESHRAAT